MANIDGIIDVVAEKQDFDLDKNLTHFRKDKVQAFTGKNKEDKKKLASFFLKHVKEINLLTADKKKDGTSVASRLLSVARQEHGDCFAFDILLVGLKNVNGSERVSNRLKYYMHQTFSVGLKVFKDKMAALEKANIPDYTHELDKKPTREELVEQMTQKDSLFSPAEKESLVAAFMWGSIPVSRNYT